MNLFTPIPRFRGRGAELEPQIWETNDPTITFSLQTKTTSHLGPSGEPEQNNTLDPNTNTNLDNTQVPLQVYSRRKPLQTKSQQDLVQHQPAKDIPPPPVPYEINKGTTELNNDSRVFEHNDQDERPTH